MQDVTTEVAREKFASSHNNGTAVPQIANVGWGNGGTDVDGNVVAPDGTAINVTGEFIQNAVVARTYPYNSDSKKVLFEVELDASAEAVVGEVLSSCGLYDSTGDLITMIHFGDKTLGENTIIQIDWVEEF